MQRDELDEILREHRIWISDTSKGKRADLQCANLQHANLHGANLHGANLQCANLQHANLQHANLEGANLHGANLEGVNLQGANLQDANLQDANLQDANLQDANLQDANLRGADLDFSCLPIWCGSLDIKVDLKISTQIAYHFCRLDCDDDEFLKARNNLIDFANGFHRVGECGMLKKKEAEE